MSRSHKIYDIIIEQMRQGVYRAGERIREEDVARRCGVSRTPVREALSRLQERGLLEASGAGLTVIRLTRQRVLDIYAIREILEGSAARFAAQHASESDLFAMEHFSNAFGQSLSDAEQMARFNRQMHDAICEAAHNSYLVSMLNALNDPLMLLPSTTFALPDRGAQAFEEHQAILEAIRQRNPDLAEKRARDHMAFARQARLKLMFDNLSD